MIVFPKNSVLAKQGRKMPVLIEAFIQDIKVQVHLASLEASSSGSIGSIKATVLSLSKFVRLQYECFYFVQNSKKVILHLIFGTKCENVVQNYCR